ncbi:MAG TPA: ribonuclease H-like domain-containing protein [Rectinemataceae bacterium]|nr:ribonuclease H-like domain-containing protein [Rectinemataceae bacterium]
MKGRLSRLKEMGLIKASEIVSRPDKPDNPDKPERPKKPLREEKSGFLPGWERIAPHTYTRTVETGFGLDENRGDCFEESHFANQRLRRKKGLNPAPLTAIPLSRLAFFDLETTGLSGGAGTVAFLAAVGFFEGGSFLVTQVFIDDFPGEPAFLDFTVNLLSEHPYLVTYNGAAFDLPLLRTRCIMNAVPVPEFGHIDLLHMARKFWRKTFGSCSLQAMEIAVLGEGREDDVPGFLIPRLWLDYSGATAADSDALETSLAAMGKVADHNLLDVRSLARLFLRVEGIMKEPCVRWESERVYVPHLAMELMAADRSEEGYTLLEEGAAAGDHGALRLLFKFYRKAGDLEACGRVIAAMDEHSVEGCIEKAKFHEHVRRDPGTALAYAEKAKAILEVEVAQETEIRNQGAPKTDNPEREGLEKRRARLLRKLGKSGDGCSW